MQRTSIVRLRIGTKFFLVLVLLIPSVLVVAWVGVTAQRRATDATDQMYSENVLDAQLTAQTQGQVSQAGGTALAILGESRPDRVADLRATFDGRLLPSADAGVAELVRNLEGDGHIEESEQLAARWKEFTDLLSLPAFETVSHSAADRLAADRLAQRLVTSLAAVGSALSDVQSEQEEQAQAALDVVEQDSARTLREILLIVGIALMAAVSGVLVLIRDVVPRVRSYSAFARQVAAGELSARLDARGADELSELGRTLDELVARRSGERDYDRAQSELNEAMQVTSSEDEAHQLLKRHLERSGTGVTATVLSRNNSANRLQPTTPLPDAPELLERLRNAQPRACLAVRLGRAHDSTPDDDSLLSCEVCGGLDKPSRCQPLLVGGEVIGSVLVQQEQQANGDQRYVSESVTLAAPVLANLRNLALAEHRALSDALTGLPNQRACHDTIRRMIAQASRSLNPMAAVLLDLDHFKQINDVYGHDRGDEVLAAVGAVLASSIRASDFGGRYGGEEFLLLFANTSAEGAVEVAEKVRTAIAGIKIASIDRPITASFGVAVMPDHATDAEALLRQADRALYSAKAAGRNQTTLVVESTTHLTVGPSNGQPESLTGPHESAQTRRSTRPDDPQAVNGAGDSHLGDDR